MALFTGGPAPETCAIDVAEANTEAEVVMIDPNEEVADELGPIKS